MQTSTDATKTPRANRRGTNDSSYMMGDLEAKPLSSEGSSTSFADPRAILAFLRQYLWVLLGTTLVCATATMFWALRQPKEFEATTTLEYDPAPRSPLGDEVQDVAQPFSNFWLTREFYETQNRIISSRQVLERTTRELKLHEDREILIPSVRKRFEQQRLSEKTIVSRVAEMLQKKVTVKPIKETRMVEIAVRDSRPKRASKIANSIAQNYLQKTIEDRLGVTEDAVNWLERQEKELRAKLENSELNLHKFKKEAKVLSVSIEDRQNVVANEIETYSKSLTEAKTKRIEIEAEVAELKRLQSGDLESAHSTSIDAHPEVTELRESYRTKRAELASLSSKYGEAHPSRMALQAEVDKLQIELRDAVGGIIRNTTADLRAAQSVERKLQGELARAQNAGLDLNLHQIEYERLNRTKESSAKLYELLLQRTTETNLTKLLKVAYAQVIDTALVPKFPVYPNVPLFAVLGAIVGLVLGAGISFLNSRLDRTVRSESEVEELGLPILGSIPALQAEGTKIGFLSQLLPASFRKGPPSRAESESSGHMDLEIARNPTGTAAEACRALRTNLTFMAANRPMRSLLVTSTVPKEGKTTTAINLAITYAQNGLSVAVVDSDLRKPRIHKTFGLDLSSGVSSYLVNQADASSIAHATEVENLFVVPAGPIPPNASELLHTERFEELVAELTSRFDRVIFDSPPLGPVTDAAVIAKKVEGTLIVSRLWSTHRAALAHMIKRLQYLGVNLAGSVVNYVDSPSNKYKYGSDYNRSYYAYQYSYRTNVESASSS